MLEDVQERTGNKGLHFSREAWDSDLDLELITRLVMGETQPVYKNVWETAQGVRFQ